jgi:hypothetical protein
LKQLPSQPSEPAPRKDSTCSNKTPKKTVEILENARDLIGAVSVPLERRNKVLLAPFFGGKGTPRTHPDFGAVDAMRDTAIAKAFGAVWPRLRAAFFEWAGLDPEYPDPDCEDESEDFETPELSSLVDAINEKKWQQARLVINLLGYPLNVFYAVNETLASDQAFMDALCLSIFRGNRLVAREKFIDDSKCSDGDLDRAGQDVIASVSLLSGLLEEEESEPWAERAREAGHQSPLVPALTMTYKLIKTFRKCGYEKNAMLLERYASTIREAVYGSDGFPETTPESEAKPVKACAVCGDQGAPESPLRTCLGELQNFGLRSIFLV